MWAEKIILQLRLLALMLLVATGLSACQTVSEPASERASYDLVSLRTSTVLSVDNIRFYPSSNPDLQRVTGWSISGLPALDDGSFDMLALSSGGPDGAFGVGILNGWSAAGNRPIFEVVTGTSTGALIAPFAFVGPKYDSLLKDLYTGKRIEGLIGAPNYFRALAGGALYQPDNLKELINTLVTRDLMTEIGRLYVAGKRLYVATANLDADELTIWDMSRIASLGTDESLLLFRRVMEAAISIPGAFAPIEIVSQTPTGPITELHGDAALLANFYIQPEMVPAQYRSKSTIYVSVHNQLKPKPVVQQASLVPLLKKSVNALSRSSTVLLLRQGWREAEALRIPFFYANLPPNWKSVSALDIDRGYMTETYNYGYDLSSKGSAWKRNEP